MSIYKAYDVRGIYPDEINQEIISKITKGFLVYFKRAGNLKLGAKILVGNDVRLSSPELKKAVVDTILRAGFDVDDMDVATTDSFYFSVGFFDYAGGIHIGASHNPPQYNGIKAVARGVDFVRGEEVEKLIPFIYEIPDAPDLGAVRKVDLLKIFTDYNLKRGRASDLTMRRKVVLDPGNGATILLLPYILPGLPIDPVIVNNELDGNFPGRGPNPYLPEVYEKLRNLVLENKADFGVAWDNDADRIMFIDETGKAIPGDT